jgi:hypothetical protein
MPDVPLRGRDADFCDPPMAYTPPQAVNPVAVDPPREAVGPDKPRGSWDQAVVQEREAEDYRSEAASVRW